MTEAEWLTGTDFTAHVLLAADRLSPRRQRLLMVGFCRAAGPLLDHPTLIDALAVIESYADGSAAPADLEKARQRCRDLAASSYEAYRVAVDREESDGLCSYVRGELAWAMAFAANTPLPVAGVGTRVATAIAQARTGAVLLAPIGTAEHNTAIDEETGRMFAVVREAAGNPFHPVTFNPDWRTSTAVALAQQMYENREFSAMPILADALQDAGCNSDEVLFHCRDTNVPHVRGCWVVDGVLGKE